MSAARRRAGIPRRAKLRPAGERPRTYISAATRASPSATANAVQSDLDRPAQRRALKQLGKFYTPDPVARAIVDWAVRDSRDRVLDPSYGGCAFFAAARSRLKALGARAAEGQLFGVDVDPEAAGHLNALLNGHRRSDNFRTADFLAVQPAAFGAGMQAIVGNPPYVRHHALSSDQLAVARGALDAAGEVLDGRASYWAYFVLHAVHFLAANGRLAFVLPAALLNADYAAPVRAALARQFRRVRLGLVRERIFDGVDESSIILLAEDSQRGPATCTLSLLDASTEIASWCAGRGHAGSSMVLAPHANGWKQSLLPSRPREVFAQCSVRDGVTTLGELARIRIGTVTGANRFFLLSAADVDRQHLPESVLGWVVDSARRLSRLDVTARDLRKASRDGHRVRLFRPDRNLTSKRARAYVDSALGEAAAQKGHCRARDPWYVLHDVVAPDAFLTYVNHGAPRIALNGAAAICTNALHRLWWKRRRSRIDARLISLSFLSSLTGLSAELYGRSYGGGVLKLEVHEAASIHVAFPPLNAVGDLTGTYRAASQYLSQGDWKAARSLANDAILETGLGLSKEAVRELDAAQDALHQLRLQAQPQR